MVISKNKKWRRPVSDIGRYRSPQIFAGKGPAKSKIVFPRLGLKRTIYLALFMLAVYFLFFSRFFTVKEVIIEGDKLVSKEDIGRFIPKGKNIFLFGVQKTKKEILGRKPEIGSVEIYRGIPNAIKVVVLEREGRIVWRSGENRYLISDQGEVMRTVTGEEGKELPEVIDKRNLAVAPGMRLVSPNFVAFIVNINQGFFGAVNVKPLAFEVDETTFDVLLRTEAGFYVKFNSLRSSKKQLENLKIVLVNKRPEIKEYVDIRIDGWAYYK